MVATQSRPRASQARATGFAIGKSRSEANRVTSYPSAARSRSSATAGSVVSRLISPPRFGSCALTSCPASLAGDSPDDPLALADHLLELPHLGREVHHPEGLLAAAVDVLPVHRA